jgi:hypothetical protein
MATREVVLRPGDTVSLRLDIPGQPMRLELALTPEGVQMSAPLPGGAPTVFGGIPPRDVLQQAAAKHAPAADADDAIEAIDLTEEFAASDPALQPAPKSAPKVESLAAVEPFAMADMALDEPAQAVDIPFDDMSEAADTAAQSDDATVTEDSSLDDLDLGDLGDMGHEEVVMGSDDNSDGAGVDIPSDDLDLGTMDEPAAVDIPLDDLGDSNGAGEVQDSGFNADGLTMLPPTRKSRSEPSLSLDEEPSIDSMDGLSLEEEDPMSDAAKAKFKPGPEDTLPVWTGRARDYDDPEVKKKKETAKLVKGAKPAPAAPAKALPGKPAPAAPAAKAGSSAAPAAASGKQPASLPAGKKPITKKVQPGGGDADGNFTVFLSPPKGADKKQAAAEIIADIQGIDIKAALALAGKMIVPVAKGISENDANGIRDRLKEAGLSCRITQKR